MTTSNSNRYLVVLTCVWVATPIHTSVTSRTLHKCSLRRDAVIHTDTEVWRPCSFLIKSANLIQHGIGSHTLCSLVLLTNLAALRCTIFNLSLLYFWYGSHGTIVLYLNYNLSIIIIFSFKILAYSSDLLLHFHDCLKICFRDFCIVT